MITTEQRTLVVIPGTRWDDTQGTDHRLAEAIAENLTVLWVDPPLPFAGPAAANRPRPLRPFYLDMLGQQLWRVRALAPPGFTKPVVRQLAGALRGRAIAGALDSLGLEPVACLLMSPRDDFPRSVTGRRLLHVTDDWVAGAALMGLDARTVRRRLVANARQADALSAVSPSLAELLSSLGERTDVRVVPNGCTPIHVVAGPGGGSGSVLLLGQLNERLDFQLLQQLAETGVPIDVIGPRRERENTARQFLDSFLASPNVRWHGEVKPHQIGALLDRVVVGITPYRDDDFNRSSFPLKTLDYLSAGLPVVATDSPAVRWLGSPSISVAADRGEFLKLVIRAADRHPDADERRSNREFAQGHGWRARAGQLMGMIDGES